MITDAAIYDLRLTIAESQQFVQCCGNARQIPRPAGENAGLRDDAAKIARGTELHSYLQLPVDDWVEVEFAFSPSAFLTASSRG
jgi:hypothetical protein